MRVEQEIVNKYTVTAGVLSYPVTFPLYEESDVSVVVSSDGGESERALTLGTDYSVSINDDHSGGTVTLVSGVVQAGDSIALSSNLPYTQELDLSSVSTIDTNSAETQLDRTTQQIQQIAEQALRSVKVPVTSTTTPEEYMAAFWEAAKDVLASVGIVKDAEDYIRRFVAGIPIIKSNLSEVEAGADGLYWVTGFGNAGKPGHDISNRLVVADGSTEARTLGERAADIINVRDFGAVGDGVTDDTEAFENAFKRASYVFVPDGTYLVGAVDISRLSGTGVILWKTGRRVSVKSIALESKLVQTFWGDLYNSRNGVVQDMSICGKYIFTSQNTDGDAYTKTGVVKITQYEMPTEIADTWDVEVKGNLQPVAEASFTGFLGHGEGCSAVYGDDGEIYIYAQASHVYDGDFITKQAATGFSRIHWRGSSTTTADIETFYGLSHVQNAGQVSVTPDGKQLVIAFSKDTKSEIYSDSAAANSVVIYDLEELLNAGSEAERKQISPKFSWVYKRDGKIGVRSGVYCDGRHIYIMTSDSSITGSEVVLVYDYTGTLIKRISIDAFASIASKEFLYGTDSGMYPESKEAEGLCYHDNSLYLMCKVNYARPASFCKFHGKTYYAIEDTTGDLPTTSQKWAPTLREVEAEEWSSETSYTGSTGYVPHKYLVAISPAGMYEKEYPLDVTAWYHDVYTAFKANGRAHVISGDGNSVTLGTLFKNFGSMLPYFSVGPTGKLYVANASEFLKTGINSTFFMEHSGINRRTDIKAYTGIGEHAFIRLGFIDSAASEPGIAFFSGNLRRLYLVPDGTSRFYGDVRPSTNNTYNLGNGALRWAQLYVASDAISTSDANEKQDVQPYPDEVLDAWGEVEFRQFLFKDAVEKKGDTARIHSGVIAQQVVEAFKKHGVEATKYGLLCYDEWSDEYETVEVEDSPAVLDADGNEVTPAQTHKEQRLVTKAGSRYGIRYSEALCLEAAYQRRRADRIEQRLNAIEALMTMRG